MKIKAENKFLHRVNHYKFLIIVAPKKQKILNNNRNLQLYIKLKR